MFTGIVAATGRVVACETAEGDRQLEFDCGSLDLSDVAIGDSIAVNGCCLTVVRLTGAGFVADVSRETLDMTTLGSFVAGTPVNLEKALRAGQPLGGHYVTGHVDGVGTVISRRPDGRSIRVEFEVDPSLGKYIARKGSVTVDGVSLTVNHASGARFGVNLVPHTLDVTILGACVPGTRVNVEVDIIARYVERLTASDDGDGPGRAY
ncbi:MAG TPA: riboflavin synthase [Steroidobacteraceae bacterium]|nr:riboflavin synthase [Steroidobacteraceae bacterium]